MTEVEIRQGHSVVARVGPTETEIVVTIAPDEREPVDLRPLAGMPLRSLVLRRPEGMSSLGELRAILPPSLPELEVLRVPHAIENWQVLAGYSSLRELDCGIFTTIESLDWTSCCTLLRVLSINVGGMASIAELGALRSLTSLDLTGYRIDLAPIANLSDLRELRIRGGRGVKGVRKLSALTSLRVLHLEELTLADLSIFAKMTELASLTTLGGVRDAKGLTGLPRLEQVALNRSTIIDLAPLATIPRLRELSLRFSRKLTDLSPLASLVKLRALDLYDASLPLESLRPLSTLRELRTLNLSCTSVADRELSPLFGLPLEQLDIDVVSPREEASLRAALPACTIHCSVVADPAS